jgi:hypothetical protein
VQKFGEGGLNTENAPIAKDCNSRFWLTQEMTYRRLIGTKLLIEVSSGARFPRISAFSLWEVWSQLEFASDGIVFNPKPSRWWNRKK